MSKATRLESGGAEIRTRLQSPCCLAAVHVVGAPRMVSENAIFIVRELIAARAVRLPAPPPPPPPNPRSPQAPPRSRPALPREGPLLPRLGGAGAGSGWLRAALAAAAAGSGSQPGPGHSEFGGGTSEGGVPTRGDPVGGSAPQPAPPRLSRSWGGQGLRGRPGAWGTKASSGGRLLPRPHPAGLIGER